MAGVAKDVVAMKGGITLSEAVRASMIAHARDEAPNECCGLLVGQGSLIDECVAVGNVHPNPTTRYLLDPAGHIAANRRLRGTGRTVLGCYHSHPLSPAVPSETDVAEAYYPDFIWLIVSLADPERPDVAAYRLVYGRFSPVALAPIP